jgi:inner membrane protein
MPTALSHPAVPLALGLGLGGRAVPPRLLAAGIVASVLPDLDVITLFHFGVPSSAVLGHRGFSHSLFFAALAALAGAAGRRALGAGFAQAFVFLFVAMASHGALDVLTRGGPGVALLWPITGERFFAPVRMIEVSPLGVAWLFSSRGATVLLSELRWIWLPSGLLTLVLAGLRFACARARRAR